MLERAGHDRAQAAALTNAISEAEQSQLLRAEGRVESRRRFKGGPIQPVASPDRQLLFLDESGKSIPSAVGLFALGGIAMTGAEAERYRSRADAVKERFWGHRGITFHEPHMRWHDEEFHFDGDVEKQAAFDAALEQVVHETDFTVFGVALRKGPFADFIAAATDPYLVPDLYSTTMQMLLERYIDFRVSQGAPRTRSKILLEAQGAREDATHQREFADILLNGTQWVPESAFQQWLEAGILFPNKHGSDPMELADMISRDVYEWAERAVPVGSADGRSSTIVSTAAGIGSTGSSGSRSSPTPISAR
jgi:hypothetical protein